jgi:hypothetical protein
MSKVKLSPGDHTRVVRAVMENMREVVARIQPTPVQVLQAALEAPSIDEDTRRVIRQVLAELPALEQAERLVPPGLRARTADLSRRLAGVQTADAVMTVLSGEVSAKTVAHDESGWNEGIQLAMEAVEDGRSTIYVAGGAGALPGAVVGAIAGGAGTSVAAAVTMAFNSLFS